MRSYVIDAFGAIDAPRTYEALEVDASLFEAKGWPSVTSAYATATPTPKRYGEAASPRAGASLPGTPLSALPHAIVSPRSRPASGAAPWLVSDVVIVTARAPGVSA